MMNIKDLNPMFTNLECEDYKVVRCGNFSDASTGKQLGEAYAILGLSKTRRTNSGWDYIDKYGVKQYTKEEAEKLVEELKANIKK